jgi:biotin operon repressor
MPPSALSPQYSKRLQRLLLLVNEIKTNLCQAPEALWASLGVSRAMLYKDRQALAAIGFTLHYDRRQCGYVITQDRFLLVLNLSISEVRAFLQTSLDDVVLQEGFGCNAAILQDLWLACQERQRVRILHDRGAGPHAWVIDP